MIIKLSLVTLSKLLLAATLLITGTSCRSDKQDDSLSFNHYEIQRQFSGWKDTILQNKNVPAEEIKKLYQLEYKVLEFSRDTSSTKIAESLNELGSARWDCFHAQQQRFARGKDTTEPRIVFYCKRPVETPLRYLPRSMIGR